MIRKKGNSGIIWREEKKGEPKLETLKMERIEREEAEDEGPASGEETSLAVPSLIYEESTQV